MGRYIRTVVALTTLVLVAGCDSRGTFSHVPWHPDTWSYHKAEDQPIVLEVARPVAIDVESFNGDVIITADDQLTNATVSILREATHGYRRKEEAQASLAEIDYSLALVPGEFGQVLQVRTWTTHAEPHFQRAHILIDVPEVDGITVRAQRGNVFVTNIEGPVDISTSQGNVRLMTNLPMRRAVTITIRQGNIDYRVRGESSGALDCQAIRGRVDHRVMTGRLIIEPDRDKGRLRATLNDGDNPITLRTADGDIRIAVVDNPTEVGWLIVEP
ncbi:MAG: DUF4097 family beta strand repeat protein [Planctomycetes bacterium]|nr:DUF4097 family beta strand repeat protein [Planctomycetota bacterium]